MTDAWIPRIYYIPSLLAGPLSAWPEILDHIAGIGFDHALVTPPFAAGETEDLRVTADHDRLHPVLDIHGSSVAGMSAIAELCRQRGLSLLVDLVVDRVAAGGALVTAHPGWFAGHHGAADPGNPPLEPGAVRIEFGRAQVLEAATRWWEDRVSRWVEAGVAGFRCDAPQHAPSELWAALITAARRLTPRARFMAWTPGCSPAETAALAPCGFDSFVSSGAWWDFHSPWLAEERTRQCRIACCIAMPEAPFGARLLHRLARPSLAPIAYRRALQFAAAEGDGILVPMGFEFATDEPLERAGIFQKTFPALRDSARLDLRGEVRKANAFIANRTSSITHGTLRQLSAPDAAVAALLRTDAADPRNTTIAMLILVNPSLEAEARLAAEGILPFTGGKSASFVELGCGPSSRLLPGGLITLAPGEVKLFEAEEERPVVVETDRGEQAVAAAMKAPRIAIERPSPAVDGGRFPVKRLVGEAVHVEADIFADGHDECAAVLLWRPADEPEWREVRMRSLGNDRWAASFPLERIGRHFFTVEAWRDAFATFRSELRKKHAAGVDVSLELEEGRRLVEAAAKERASEVCLHRLAQCLACEDYNSRIALLLGEEAAGAMSALDLRPFAVRWELPLPVEAERTAARFASWYELFPRSEGGDPGRHGTFVDVVRRLPMIRDMGFDVLYFPPIHPIGRTNRKGRNNSLEAESGDPGSPYAIGAEEGGHDAIHPALGTLDDFRSLRDAAAGHGLEIALDFAIQCSPDHPWLREHPKWFSWRPDGSLRYAENPPKKYEDIVNVDFYASRAMPSLWLALRDVVLFWVKEGIRTFRVDNPHTKPFPFWEWMIADIRGRHPDVIFLSEAFTRPKVMYRLAKLGFSQSYTYFTWRNAKHEIQSYLSELTTTNVQEYFRPHFFVNTPDINPRFLQNSGRPGFLMRAALAATLSGLWGMYSGFELCEAEPIPGKEEYLHSEKYEIKARNWNQPGNIIREIAELNRIRRQNPALQSHLGLTFYNAFDDRVLYYGKSTPARDNVILVAVNLDPKSAVDVRIEIPLWEFGLPDDAALAIEDLMHEQSFIWRGKIQQVRLDPADRPFAIWRIRLAGEA